MPPCCGASMLAQRPCKACVERFLSPKLRPTQLECVCAVIFLTRPFAFFSGGFAFLPFLWAINSVWFFKEAFVKEQYEQQRQIRRCKTTVGEDRMCLVSSVVQNTLCSFDFSFRCSHVNGRHGGMDSNYRRLGDSFPTEQSLLGCHGGLYIIHHTQRNTLTPQWTECCGTLVAMLGTCFFSQRTMSCGNIFFQFWWEVQEKELTNVLQNIWTELHCKRQKKNFQRNESQKPQFHFILCTLLYKMGVFIEKKKNKKKKKNSQNLQISV